MIKLRSKIDALALIAIVLIFFSFVITPLVAQAQGSGGKGFSTDNPLGAGGGGVADKFFGCGPEKGVTCVIVNILIFLASIAFIVAVFFLVLGGFRYVTAGSNEEAVEKAKKIITHSIIGLVIIISSWIILTVVVRVAQFGERGSLFGF